MRLDSKCKICRRQGVKLFLRGERCYSAKCAMVKRPYPPGIKGKRRKGAVSEYARELSEKQKLRQSYGLGEAQFRRYAQEILARVKNSRELQDPSNLLFQKLESRLDNVVFRLGLAASRGQARQMVSHGYFLVNGRSVNVPSLQTKKGQEVKIKPEKLKKGLFQNLSQAIKKQKLPVWLEFDSQNMVAKVVGEPLLGSEEVPAEISTVFEFYSR